MEATTMDISLSETQEVGGKRNDWGEASYDVGEESNNGLSMPMRNRKDAALFYI